MNKKFKLGDIVYYVTDEMQAPAVITGVIERVGHYKYFVANKHGEYECYEMELSTEKTIF